MAPTIPLDSITYQSTIAPEGLWQPDRPLSLGWSHSSALPENATDEDRFLFLLRWAAQRRPATSAHNNSTAQSSSSGPIFGSTALRPGMHAQMASMNQQASSNESSNPSGSSPNDVANPEPNHHTPPPPEAQHIQWAGAKSQPLPPPPLPPLDELEQELADDDQLFRRFSEEQLYWYTDEESDKWQVNLVRRLVRAKHELLDAKQNSFVRLARRLARVREIEECRWMRTIRRDQQERRKEKEGKGKRKI
ncbi:hypothetical protein Hte_000392 [Hypoxylon texense]